jgi:phospho-N-acetylmuramoyl-pentapeptide-transferase
VLVACALGVFAYASGNVVFANYLQIRRSRAPASWSSSARPIAGAGLRFLWFNTYPAMVFMGDIGALALGAVLGTIAVITRQELVLVIMGGVVRHRDAVGDDPSPSFKLTGKRVFRMALRSTTAELKKLAGAARVRSGSSPSCSC